MQLMLLRNGPRTREFKFSKAQLITSLESHQKGRVGPIYTSNIHQLMTIVKENGKFFIKRFYWPYRKNSSNRSKALVIIY